QYPRHHRSCCKARRGNANPAFHRELTDNIPPIAPMKKSPQRSLPLWGFLIYRLEAGKNLLSQRSSLLVGDCTLVVDICIFQRGIIDESCIPGPRILRTEHIDNCGVLLTILPDGPSLDNECVRCVLGILL